MAFVWMDGFEIHQVAGYITRKYSCIGTPVGPNTGRLHGNSMDFSGVNAVTPSLGVDTVYTVGFGCWAASGNYVSLLIGGVPQFTISFNASRQVQVRRGDNAGTILETGATSLPAGGWAYLEFKVTLSDSGLTGAYEVRIDTILEVNNGGATIQTIPTGNPSGADQLRVVNFQRLDDLYILNNAAGANNFLGDTVIEGLQPSGAGAFTDWSVTGAANNWDAVSDNATVPTDNDYVSSDTNGNKDFYDFGNLGFITGSIHCVMACIGSRMETGAGTRTIRAKFRDTGTNEGGFGNRTINGTGVSEYCALLETDPTGGGAWSISEINSGQFGLEVMS